MGRRKKSLSLNIYSLISLLLTIVTISFFAFDFLRSGSGLSVLNGFQFVAYPFQRLFDCEIDHALLLVLQSQNKTATQGLLLGIFTDFSLLFAALYLILTFLRVAGLIRAKRNTLPLMIMIASIFLLGALVCAVTIVSELKAGEIVPTTQIYWPFLTSLLASIFSLLRR